MVGGKQVEPALKPPKPASTRHSSLLPATGVPLPPTFDDLPVLSRADIASRIANGELLVIHAPLVYKIPPAWLKLHPGGDLSILHYVGRDASNEIEAYHVGKTVTERMSRWVCGRVELGKAGWRDMVPPVQLNMWPIPVPKITVSLVDADGKRTERKVQNGGGGGGVEQTALTAEMVNPDIDGVELPLTPEYQQHLRLSHRKLQDRVRALGLDSPPPFLSGYGPSLVIYISLFVLWVYLYRTATSNWGYFASAIALGAWWHQVTFVVHDAAHTELTGDWWTDRLAAILMANFMGGMSAGWWANNHNVHHLVTNSPENDPDIQHLPFLAISTKFFASLRSTYYKRVMAFDAVAHVMIPLQHKLYYVIMGVARFNLFAQSYDFLLSSAPARASPLYNLRILEFVGVACFWSWFIPLIRGVPGTWMKVGFVMTCFVVPAPLHVQIVLSHFSQSVSVASEIVPHLELLESHAHRQLRTTMDISCPEYLDFLHGGLNFQVPHHLLPRTPRFRFRAVAKEVEKWVKEEQALVVDGVWEGHRLKENEGLVFKKMEFVEANRDVLGVLESVAQQVKFIAKVAAADARGELHHAH
ncbi:delta8-fatty-acid desaturase [Pseudohyphozyma bogoriensis]|nr:delta8-fatty-acid desaturase [Pseudohyphozyma bogoriensis]